MADSDTSPLGTHQAVVLKCTARALRIRVRGEQEAVTLRCSSRTARTVAPAQHVQVTLTKRWSWGGDTYATGTVDRVWTDVAALGLQPLLLHAEGDCTLADTFEPFLPPDPYAQLWDAAASQPRASFEIDGIAWGAGVGVDPDDPQACLVADAQRVTRSDPELAREILMEALVADLRCIDAHVHLGNLEFDRRPEQAMVHYEIAVALGDLSFPHGFDGLLLWSHVHNRSFLRALHGLGLCLWRLGRDEEALQVFERGLALNPPDNQGLRFCWDDLRGGLPWPVDAQASG